MVTIREALKRRIDKGESGEALIVAVADETGCQRDSVMSKYRKLTGTSLHKSKPQVKARNRTEEFRATYDKSYIVPQKVRDAIETWLSLPNVLWAPDEDMRNQCGVAAADWKKHARENPEFEQHIVHLPGKKVAWAYTPKYAEELQRRAIQ